MDVFEKLLYGEFRVISYDLLEVELVLNHAISAVLFLTEEAEVLLLENSLRLRAKGGKSADPATFGLTKCI